MHESGHAAACVLCPPGSLRLGFCRGPGRDLCMTLTIHHRRHHHHHHHRQCRHRRCLCDSLGLASWLATNARPGFTVEDPRSGLSRTACVLGCTYKIPILILGSVHHLAWPPCRLGCPPPWDPTAGRSVLEEVRCPLPLSVRAAAEFC